MGFRDLVKKNVQQKAADGLTINAVSLTQWILRNTVYNKEATGSEESAVLEEESVPVKAAAGLAAAVIFLHHPLHPRFATIHSSEQYQDISSSNLNKYKKDPVRGL